MNYLKQSAETAVLEVQELTKEKAQYIVVGTQDGWLEYDKKSYEEALKWLECHGKNV